MIVRFLHTKFTSGRPDEVSNVAKSAAAIYIIMGAGALYYGKRSIALVALLGLIDVGYVLDMRKRATIVVPQNSAVPPDADVDIAEYVPEQQQQRTTNTPGVPPPPR